MAGLGQLAAGVAHEINNPISFILSNIHNLNQYNQFFHKLIDEYKAFVVAKSGDDGTADEIIRRIDDICREEDLDFVLSDSKDLLESTEEGVNRVIDIVKNMKTFSHPGSEKFQPEDIHEIIESALDLAHNQTKYNAKVIKAFNASPSIVHCNKNQLGRVFLNLIVNASHAIGDQNQGIIKVMTECKKSHLVVHVIDSGCGIKQDKLKKIFEPFYTSKEVGKGTGLGLSISYGIIKKHKGKISVISTPGKGTKFTLSFPTSESQ